MKKNLKLINDLRIKIAILSISLYVAGNSIVSGTVVFMQNDLGISMTSAESLITISSVATIVTMLLSERVTQKKGMKNCVLIGLFLVGLSSLIPVFFKTYIGILISRIIMGAGVGLFNGHSANYINVFFSGDEASRLHGIRMSTEFIGQMVLLFVAGLLIKIHWSLAFLSYAFAFLLLFNFNKTIPNREVEEKDEEDLGKFKINKQIIFYVLFAAIMIMNVSSVTVRFPSVATQSKGMGVDVNLYMIILPMAGMISGFLFGLINNALREKTILLGLSIYAIFNTILALFGENMYIYLVCMVLIAFSQSLCTPYLFNEVARFIRGSHARIANNLIFVGCNLGGFLAPFFLSFMHTILRSNSLTLSFLGFSVIYIILLLINLREFAKLKHANKSF